MQVSSQIALALSKKASMLKYWSMSKLDNCSEMAEIKIFIQNSQKGRDISKIGLDEQEVVYERNSIFEILNKVQVDGVWYILMKEVQNMSYEDIYKGLSKEDKEKMIKADIPKFVPIGESRELSNEEKEQSEKILWDFINGKMTKEKAPQFV